ncbi:MAG: hypothetical protein ACREE6_16685, partial [Limisphaerales bacterium]
MGSMVQNDTAVVILLITHLLTLAIAGLCFAGFFLRRRARLSEESSPGKLPSHAMFPQRPSSWLAIRAATPERVRNALG